MAKVNYAILNATLVALVAVGGMVIYFSSGGAVGAYNYDERGIFKIGTDQDYYTFGDSVIGAECMTYTTEQSDAEWSQCCALRCDNWCNSLGIQFNPTRYGIEENEFKNCGKGCIQGCRYRIIRDVSIGFDYRGVRDTSPGYRG